MRLAWRVSVACGLLGAIVLASDAGATAARLRGASPEWLAACATFLAVQTMLMALRWRATAASLGLAMSVRRAVGEYFLAQLVNMTVPGGVIGDVVRAVRTGPRREAAAHAVIVERAAGQVFMAVLAGTGAVVGLAMGRLPAALGWSVIGVLTAGVLAAALAMRASWKPLGRLVGAARVALLARGAWPLQAGLGVAIAGLNTAAFWAAARATGTALTLEEALAVVPLILAAMVVPATVGGWGWREGAAAALFPIAGASAAGGVAAGVAFGLVLTAVSLPAVIWLIVERGATTRDLPRADAVRSSD